jgi:hypothetical protein
LYVPRLSLQRMAAGRRLVRFPSGAIIQPRAFLDPSRGSGFERGWSVRRYSTALSRRRHAIEFRVQPGPFRKLHPPRRFAEAIAGGVRAGDHDGFAAVRELIESVIVQRNPARQSGVEVTITGRLNAVLGEPRVAAPPDLLGRQVLKSIDMRVTNRLLSRVRIVVLFLIRVVEVGDPRAPAPNPRMSHDDIRAAASRHGMGRYRR